MLAKISVPRLTESHPRPRLFRALDAARRKKVVWVSAPAGAGKTSVVAMYLEVRRVPALWYNVDARDGDAAHLFHYLALAVRRASRRRRASLPVFASENQRVAAYLDERVCWLDLWAFDELTEEAQRELARGAPSCAFVALAEHLLHVYRGPLLDDDAAPWIVGPRERVAARFRRVAEVLGRKLECDGYLDESAALRQRMELPSHHFAERHRVRDPLAHRATRS